MSQSDWFAVRVKSNFEKPVSRALRGKGFEDYVPCTGYGESLGSQANQMNCPFSLDMYSAALRCTSGCQRSSPFRGCLHIVGVRGAPIPIDAAELAYVAIIESGLRAEPWPFLRTGQCIVVEKGPLAGVEGFVVEVKRNFRLVASVNLLQRSVSIEIDRSWVRQVRGDGISPLALVISGSPGPLPTVAGYRQGGPSAVHAGECESMNSNQRTRVICFRTSDAEYQDLRSVCAATGVRSISGANRAAPVVGASSPSGERATPGTCPTTWKTWCTHFGSTCFTWSFHCNGEPDSYGKARNCGLVRRNRARTAEAARQGT